MGPKEWASEKGYREMLTSAYADLVPAASGAARGPLWIDAACGVGAPKIASLAESLAELGLRVSIANGVGEAELNKVGPPGGRSYRCALGAISLAACQQLPRPSACYVLSSAACCHLLRAVAYCTTDRSSGRCVTPCLRDPSRPAHACVTHACVTPRLCDPSRRRAAVPSMCRRHACRRGVTRRRSTASIVRARSTATR